MNEDDAGQELNAVGLRPRLLAAAWFAATSLIPVVFFLGVFNRMSFDEGHFNAPIASLFIALPVCMAAFFGFTVGSAILDEQLVTSGLRAAGYGVVVAGASYAGMMGGYAALMVLSSTKSSRLAGDPAEAIKTFLTIVLFGAVLIGWLVVIAGAAGGWLLFHWASSLSAPTISWVTRNAARRLNYWAAAGLLVAMFICWLPWHTAALREQARGNQNDLRDAVWRGESDRVEEFLARGASPDMRDVAGETLLSTAAEKGNTGVIKVLLQHGANPNVTSIHPGHPTPLQQAVMNFDVESIKALLDRGANINTPDDFGRTPFLLAVSATDSDTVKLLIDHGADVRDRTRDGSSALTLARRFRDSTGNRDRLPAGNDAPRDAGMNFGDSRDFENPAIMKRAHDRHDAIIQLLMNYGIK